MAAVTHPRDCDWQLDQYDHECTCGAVHRAVSAAVAAEPANWIIEYDPPPIPTRNCDWSFVHKDYDGEGDVRHGCAATFAEACEIIADIEAGLAQ